MSNVTDPGTLRGVRWGNDPGAEGVFRSAPWCRAGAEQWKVELTVERWSTTSVTTSGLVALMGGALLSPTVAGFVVWPVLVVMVGCAVAGWRRRRRGRPVLTPSVAMAAFVVLWALISAPQMVGSSGQDALALIVGVVPSATFIAFLAWALAPDHRPEPLAGVGPGSGERPAVHAE